MTKQRRRNPLQKRMKSLAENDAYIRGVLEKKDTLQESTTPSTKSSWGTTGRVPLYVRKFNSIFNTE